MIFFCKVEKQLQSTHIIGMHRQRLTLRDKEGSGGGSTGFGTPGAARLGGRGESGVRGDCEVQGVTETSFRFG